MTIDEVSRRRGATSELTFIAPIKRGNVPNIRATLSYSDRLKRILTVFNDRENAFNGRNPVPLGLRAFQGIHFAHLVLIDGDTRFLFAVSFDGSASSYLAGLSTDVPWLVHLVFSNCVGWQLIDQRPQVLIEFITRHQVETNFWYAHSPQTSVRDAEWLQALRREVEHAPADTNARQWSAQLQAAATQACAPRTHARRLAQMFAMQEDSAAAEAHAKAQFQGVFEPLYERAEWTAAYRETFGEDVPGGKP